MSSKISNLMVFAAGAAVGMMLSWRIAEKKYSQIAEEEIRSVKETYSRREAVVKSPEDTGMEHKENIVQYAAMIRQYGSNADAVKEETAKPLPVETPYVISPEEFGELDDYDKISLTYYSDGVVTDDRNEILDDVESVIGAESLDHFGEYEDDSVFVRNDRLKCDYEILLEQRAYTDIPETKPPANGDGKE